MPTITFDDLAPYGNVGQLIDRPYQYEFNGYLFGSNTELTVVEVTGLIGHESQSSTEQNYLSHGGIPGLQSFNSKTISFSMVLTGSKGEDIEEKLADLRRRFSLPPRKWNTLVGDYQVHGGFKVHPAAQLVFHRPGFATPRVIFARCLRFAVASNYDTSMGYAEVEVDFEAVDPLTYSLNIHRMRMELDDTELTAVSYEVEQAGDHPDGYAPVFNVTSASSPKGFYWPHFAKAYYDDFEDRTITQQIAFKLFRVGDAFFDLKSRTTTPLGIINSTSSDNWWSLMPGTSTVRFLRYLHASNGPVTVDMLWRDVWK